MALDYYISNGGRRLRCGYTTGTCAALAAAAAARLLLTGQAPEQVGLRTPKGILVEVPVETPMLEGDTARCAVTKDGGDDVDATHGLAIVASVTRCPGGELRLAGGEGVGRVTRPGLDQPVGQWAINRVPRAMILEAVDQVRRELDEPGGLSITISVPGGREAAKKTFNPQLGVEGGISILGTSGIVEPMSVQAIVDTMALELRQKAEMGFPKVILTPGNYGMEFICGGNIPLSHVPVVKCSNFIGQALDLAVEAGFQEILLVGHVGKLVKVAGGAMNTHSRTADGRRETLAAHTALQGGDRALVRAVFESPTTDRAVELLETAGLREPVLASIAAALDENLKHRAGERMQIEAVFFSNQFGVLGKTPGADRLLALHRAE